MTDVHTPPPLDVPLAVAGPEAGGMSDSAAATAAPRTAAPAPAGADAARDRAAAIASLTPEQLAKLQERLRALRAGASPAPAGIPRREGTGPVPLSFAQQRLWFVDRLEPGSPAYNVPFALRLRGPLDAGVLARCLDEVVRRHETLRTTFPEADGEPVQAVAPAGRIDLPVIDLAGLAEDARAAEARRMVRDEALRPFDLANGPLLRATLLRLGADEHLALFTLHHVVSDAWSTAVLARELSALYAAFSRGAPSPLPALPVQYADYAVWQRARLSGAFLEEQLDWWRRTLAGAPPVLELPTDRPRPARPDPAGGSVSFTLPDGLGGTLAELSRREGDTLFMTLLAAWSLLLSRYAGQDDVVVGSPVANRTRPEEEGLIGFFANTLALRTDLSGDPTFRALLGRVREAVLGAHAHQELPFERLVEELDVDRSAGSTPVFQAMLVFGTAGREGLRMGQVQAEVLETPAESAKFDLLLMLSEQDGALRGTLEYRTSLFDASTIGRMVDHFRVLLQGIAADPDRRLSALPMLAADERARVLDGFNATAAAYPADACVHDLFAAAAARAPDAPAVAWAGGEMTYAELDGRANRLARHLRARGVGPDARVGVCLERGPEMMVSVLAVLKAGAAYVPVDPAYPADRIAYMLVDSAAPVLLTQASVAEALPATDAIVVRVDADAEAIAAESAEPVASGAHPDGLAYVIYTSGSTGRPKGVAMTHRPLVNLLAWQQREWRHPSASTTLQFTTLSFDVSFQEIFSCWHAGGRLVLVGEDERRDLAAVLARLDEDRVERLFLPYVALQHLAELAAERGTAPRALREVQTAGEQLRVTGPIRRLFTATGATLSNQYGPSETHVVTAEVLRGEPAAWPALPGIGGPVANTRCYVLDAGLEPAPVGVPGELYLAGACLARGYLARPALTAERFVADPFATPGARMYRTGDRARWRADGTLEFLGRADDQVKVRGFRIEPGEVEAALESHPGVREAVVVVREDAPGDRRLAGYVVPAAGAEVSPAELRAHLQGRLPEYMVPSAFVVLDAFPLTPSGKVARRALPAPDGAPDAAAYVAPRTPAEEALAGIFGEVLRVSRVGATDDFFALGGHSLLATRVVARVRGALGVDLPLRAMFDAPTVAGLAAEVERLRGCASVQAPPLVPIPRDGELPLSFAQHRLWFIDQLEPGSAAYNLPFALRLRGALDEPALGRALDALAGRHESLRTRFPSAGGEPVQVIDAAGPVRIDRIDLSGLADDAREAAVREVASAEALRPFDLAAGPLLRTTLVRLGAQEHALLCTMHHAISDGWSIGILVREVSALYAAFAEGREPSLPDLPVQYADFAAWQRRWLSGDVLQAQLGWWRERLAGAPPVLALPTDRPRPPVPGPAGRRVPFELTADVTGALNALSRREGATLFMTLLAAWQLLLAKLSGQDDVSVGTPIAGRTRLETEGLIGFFVNTLVLRARLDGDPTFRALLAQVREGTLGAYQHQDLPFEKLVEELAPGRSGSHTPLFQVMFVVQNNAREALRLGALHAEDLDAAEEAVKFDLTLSLEERGGRLAGTLSYRTELFDERTVRRMLDRFRALLAAVAADASRPVSAYTLLDADERRAILALSNPGATPFPTDRCVHALFAEQAAATPDAVAAEFGDARLTYAELDGRANRLAHHLRALGAGPESRVGIAVDRTERLVVAALAALKAGAAYVPLDRGYPAERLAFMIADTAVSIVLVDDGLPEALAGFGGDVVSLARDAARVAAMPADDPAVDADPLALAYVVYTSGSTGRPKGIGIPHRAVVRLVRDSDYVRLTPADRLGQIANPAFDAFTFELWGALLNGGAVVGIDRHAALSPAALADALREARITAGFVTSALFTQVAREAPDGFRGMRHLLVGGDAVDPASARRVLRAGAPERLLNGYGPSECTTFAVWHHIAAVDEDAATIPIGRPLANTTAYVLDRGMEPVPAGVTGELYLGGPGLARGYLGRPGLTAEKFVPSPFGGGERLYRTGDAVRWSARGEIEFMGRLDFQVKIRGFRVEPGEVEAALLALPSVAEAVVLVREDAPGDRRLAAYVSPAEGAELSASGLRAALKATLPDYMVPGAFVLLERLPLNANGKVDRRALPAPEAADDAAAWIAPRTATEARVAEIFADVLDAARVGAAADFFALGGHSLLATRLVSRVREAFGVELPLRALFDAPTVEGLAARVDALLARDAGTAAPPIVPVPREGALPLSFAQQRLWFVDQLQPGSPAYNVPAALRVRGALDVPALERALGEIVRRHEALRTTFATGAEGEPVQVIHPPFPLSAAVQDLRGVAAEQVEDEARRRAADEALRPFDLGAGPLLRARVLRLADDEWVLLFTMHHVVSDGWSMEVLVREASALYAAFAEGREAALPELPVQYADYAVWQRAWMAGEVLDAQLGWWRERLAGAPAVLEIPTDRPRPPVPSGRGASAAFALPESATRALRELSRAEGATLFMTLLAGWQLLLSKYSGQDDVSVGSPVAGRTRLETEGLIGFFVNTLVLRTDLSGEPTFRALVGRAREAALGAYQHQDVPFERLVEELAPERSLSHSPLFQVMFALRNDAGAELRLGSLRAEPLAGAGETARFDLSLALFDTDGGLQGRLTYRPDLFDAATAERMLAHYAVLLQAVAADPDRGIGEISILADAERRRVVEEWNAADAELPAERRVHALFAAQAARTPDAVAVRAPDAVLTYAELDALSSRLARHLRALGVHTDARVALCIERGPHAVAALLATLKAGAAYVALDPSDPAERLRFVLDDVAPAAVITRAGLADRVPFAGPVVRLDADAEAVSAHSSDALAPAGDAESGAFLVYTSGSTGTPKGVLVQHGGLANYLAWYNREVMRDGDVSQPLVSRLSFDAHARMVLAPLVRGGAVWIIPEAAVTDPAALLRILASRGDVGFGGVPSLWSAMLDLVRSGEGPRPDGLRLVGLGGEALPPELLRKTREAFPGVAVWNHYGPTETTVNFSVARVETAERITVGRPIANVRGYVLDARMNPVPAGVPGELYAGGAGVARGYHGRPALTAERFLPDPFSARPGARMYRTGDRVRWTADGELDYLGRTDQQVKVRGFRIELGEIETLLHRHAGVREAAAAVRQDDGQARLVAYVVPMEGAAPSPEELRGALKARLPEHMLPSAFVMLDALPLSRNGKVDRRALPAPDASALARADYVAPRTPEEERVAAIWAEVLGVERVGANDGFFALGGHSLRATRVVSHASRAFGVEVPVRTLFQAPTLAEFAAEVARLAAVPGAAPLAGIVTRGEVMAALEDVDSLSEEEMDRLLNQLSTDEDAEW